MSDDGGLPWPRVGNAEERIAVVLIRGWVEARATHRKGEEVRR